MDKIAPRKNAISLSLLDKIILKVAPQTGLSRIRAHMAVKALEGLGYVGGGRSRRSMLGWITGTQDADAALLPQLTDLRNRSHDLYRNSPLATGAIRRTVTNAIGPGLTLQCRIDRTVLDISDDEAEAWERNTEVRFRAWAESKDCDLTRTDNFYDQQSLAFLSMLLSGDVFCLLPRIKTLGMDNDLRVALYESDFVSNPNYAMDTDLIAGGIELDSNGAPAYYHFSDHHPGNITFKPLKWQRIAAFGPQSGRRQVIHLLTKERPGQRRGVPLLSPVIESLKQISRYSESELMAAVVTSFFTVFIKQQTKIGDPLQAVINSGNPTSQIISSNPNDQSVVNPENPAQQNQYEMGNGNIVGLGDGEDIVLADPKRPNAAFDPFFIAICREIGSALEIPYELLILHFSASYSASRAALLEAWKFFRIKRNRVARNYCDPVYQEWLYEEILTSRIIAPGYFSDNLKRFAWQGTQWQGPGQGQIDPVKETDGALKKIAGNLSTYETEFVQIQGGLEGNWDAAMSRSAREKTFLIKKGLLPDNSKKNNTAAGNQNKSGNTGA